jgi:tetratricopeptide (TPR) repeat protein
MCGVLAVAVLLWPWQQAGADETQPRVRELFASGQSHYDAGEYDAALRDFEEAYRLSKLPAFLVDIAQVDRKLGRLQEAKALLLRYLDDAANSSPAVSTQLREIVADIDRELAERAPAASAPEPPSPKPEMSPPAQPTASPTSPPIAVAPAQAAIGSASPAVIATPPPRRSFARRNWWIFPSAAVVLAGVAVGIYFGVRPTGAQVHCSDARVIGCIDAL